MPVTVLSELFFIVYVLIVLSTLPTSVIVLELVIVHVTVCPLINPLLEHELFVNGEPLYALLLEPAVTVIVFGFTFNDPFAFVIV